MVEKGWSQSELSRRAQATAEAHGVDVRIGPDSVSHYVNGRYLPSPPLANVLAETLGVSVQELLPPDVPEVGETTAMPPVSVEDMQDGLAWLRINQAVPWPIAVKVLDLLRGAEEETPKG